MPPRELHATSGPRFLADTVVPTYVGAWVRIGLLRMMMGTRAPTIGQMISADGLILLVEGGITVVVVVALTFGVGLPLVVVRDVIGLAGAGALVALWLKKRYADRPFVRTFNVLAQRNTLFALTGLLTVVLVVQPIRFWIVINGVGIDSDFVEAVLAFLATSIIGGLPVGPGPASVGATGVVFSSEELGLIAASGIGLTATAFVAALIYSLAGLAIAGPGDPGRAESSREARHSVDARGRGHAQVVEDRRRHVGRRAPAPPPGGRSTRRGSACGRATSPPWDE